MSKTIPSRLYKYQSLTPSSHTVDNLRHRQIWFSKPENLNDPFDCAIPFLTNERVNEDEWQDGFDNGLLKIMENDKTIDFDSVSRQAIERFLTEGKVNQQFKDDLITVNQNVTAKALEEYKNIGVACFSSIRPEEPESILMWSHYTLGHKGICLEFDTSYFPFREINKVHEVLYSNTYPVISPVSVLMQKIDRYEPLLTKSVHWEYECEWRLFMLDPPGGNNALTYEPLALTGIYFGCAMLDEDIDKIVTLPASSAPRLYRMKRSKTEFKLEYEPYHP